MTELYIFISNCIINSFILVLTAAFLRLRPRAYKVIISAVVGGAYSLVGYYFTGFTMLWFLPIIGSALVCICFGYRSFWLLMRNLLVFILATITFGGLVSLIFGGEVVGLIPALCVPIAAGISIPMCKRIEYAFRRTEIKMRSIRVLKIENYGTICELRAFEDTGNMLYEPISGLPVFIVKQRWIQKILPQILVKGIDDGKRISILHYSTLSGNDKSIMVFKPDKVTVDGRSFEFLIGIFRGKLSSNGDFHALINLMATN